MLKDLPEEERQARLEREVQNVEIPPLAFLPIFKGSDPWARVTRVKETVSEKTRSTFRFWVIKLLSACQ